MSSENGHRILVTGATGRVGRHVVDGLVAAGAEVRALVRDATRARFPEGVEIAVGDLTRPETLGAALEDVGAVFLVWPSFGVQGAQSVVGRIAEESSRLVYLSAMHGEDRSARSTLGPWAEIEGLIERSGLEWTFLRAGGFAANTLEWAEEIRRDGVVRWIYGAASRSLVHEKDVAAVAVHALLDDRHVGKQYVLTGPEAITQAEQVGLIGEVIGRPARWEELPLEAGRQQMLAAWGDSHLVEGALRYWGSLVDDPEPVTRAVEAVTGVPARSFSEWIADHAADFQATSEEVANAYVDAFQHGRMDEAVRWFADDVIRIAPLETGGAPVERRGLAEITGNSDRLTADVEIHRVDIDGPFLAPGQFAVRFTFDATHRPTGERGSTSKMSLYTVGDGRIVREEVYYFTAPHDLASDDLSNIPAPRPS